MSLFWKVFAALLVSLLMTAMASSWLSRTWLMADQVIESRISSLLEFGQTAVEIYAAGGIRAYRQWLHQQGRNHIMIGALLDEHGRSLLPRPLPPELHQLAQQAAAGELPRRMIRLPMIGIIESVSFGDQRYIWLASSRLSPGEMRSTGIYSLAIKLAIAILALILVSWLLTRMVTRPVRQLQQSTIRLGDGDLQATAPTALATRGDEFGDLARSFDTMAGQLGSLIHSHQKLLSDISHELRSPLARLQLALELARHEAGDKAAGELDRIELEAGRLNALIDEVLTLARFDQQQVHNELQAVQLDQLLQEIATDAAFEAEAMNRHIRLQQPEPCCMMADPVWLRRGIENVIRNAIHHSVTGSSVDIELRCESNSAVVMVRDHGKGVDEALLPRLFDAFFRISEARETDGSGYGLGLAIARRVINLHQGVINASNHPEGGLQMEIRLPRVHISE